MFPYAIISASRLLGNKKTYIPKPPKIETLQNYIKISNEDFYELLFQKSKKVGICEMCDMISNWQGFDNLTQNQKIRFVRETIEPEYYSMKNYIKRTFDNIFNKNKK